MNRLSELKIRIISLVKSPANRQKFLITKTENKEGVEIPVEYKKGGKLEMDIKKIVELGLISKEDAAELEAVVGVKEDEAVTKATLKEISEKVNSLLEKGKESEASELVKELKKLNDILVKKDEKTPADNGEEKPKEDGEGEEKPKDGEEEQKPKEPTEEEIEKQRTEKLVEIIKTTNDPQIYKKAQQLLRDGGDIPEDWKKETPATPAKDGAVEDIQKSVKKLNEKIDTVILKSNQIESQRDEVKKDEKGKSWGGSFI